MFGQLAVSEAIADYSDGLALISKAIQLVKARDLHGLRLLKDG